MRGSRTSALVDSGVLMVSFTSNYKTSCDIRYRARRRRGRRSNFVASIPESATVADSTSPPLQALPNLALLPRARFEYWIFTESHSEDEQA